MAKKLLGMQLSKLGIAQFRHFEPKEWLYSFDFTCRKSN
jgi:hypothetical protein